MEDSYLNTKTFDEALAKINVLALSLIARLENELVDTPPPLWPANAGSSSIAPAAKDAVSTPAWVRYPTRVRLSYRSGRTGRESKSATMPIDALDITVSKEKRASDLTKGVLRNLLTKMVKGKKDGFDLHV